MKTENKREGEPLFKVLFHPRRTNLKEQVMRENPMETRSPEGA